FGPDIAPDGKTPERKNWNDVILVGRLADAIDRLNPHFSSDAREDALRKVLRAESPSLVLSNRRFHEFLADGVDVETRSKEGRIAGDKAWLADFDHPENNDWLVVNQFAVIEDGHSRRPDLVVFLNGLPFAVFELKNPADEEATIWAAHRQLQTYQVEIPALFRTNELLII
ncbi:type i restriction enzyme hindviip r protein, partial [mine drainage metagenome]